MSASGASRRRVVLVMAGGALVAAALGGLSLLPPGEARARGGVGEPVVSGFETHADDIRLIMVTTSEESYHLVRQDDGWVLPEKGGYTVRPEQIGELVRAVASLRHARPMTRDDRKFDRIGLGDPAAGGTGALLEIGNGQGDSFAKLLVGYRNGTSYVRQPDDLQAWAVSGEVMPPLQRGARWLDLDIVRVAEGDIADVQVRPVAGPGYTVRPVDAAGAQFALAPPLDARRLVASFAPTLPGQALSRLSPADVAPEAEIRDASPSGDHVTRTKQGLVVTVRAWRRQEQGWVTITAAGPGAEAVNARASGWAFLLTDADWGVFVTPLAAIVAPDAG